MSEIKEVGPRRISAPGQQTIANYLMTVWPTGRKVRPRAVFVPLLTHPDPSITGKIFDLKTKIQSRRVSISNSVTFNRLVCFILCNSTRLLILTPYQKKIRSYQFTHVHLYQLIFCCHSNAIFYQIQFTVNMKKLHILSTLKNKHHSIVNKEKLIQCQFINKMK